MSALFLKQESCPKLLFSFTIGLGKLKGIGGLILTSVSLAGALSTAATEILASSLFPNEKLQLTEGVLLKLSVALQNGTISSLFDFANDSTSRAVAKNNPPPFAAKQSRDWPEYNATQCATIAANWFNSDLNMEDPASIILPLYQGRSCLPPPYNCTAGCTRGGYPTYAVNVSTVAQIQLAVNFARNLNLRLVVKNTGYDFNGKALENMLLLSGPTTSRTRTIKFGSGIQVFKAYEFAKRVGHSVVGGEAVTVGLGGGYTADGGHSPLSTVLANGHFITATSTENADIFWMRRGGGVNDTPGPDAFWSAVEAYLDNFEKFVDAGTYGYYYTDASSVESGTDYAGSTDYHFRIESFVAPNMSVTETKTLLAPWFNALDNLNVSFTPWYNHADNFHDAWVGAFPQEYVGADVVKTASRLLPRSVFQSDDLRNQTFESFKDAIIKSSSLFVTKWMDVLREIAPDSGAYMSEADLLEPKLQEAFYGTNYSSLYALKQKHDPTSLFFALTAVGAEDWEVQTVDPLPYSWNNNGRLCPKSS
ncbi:CAZyme family AA7 [Penicillium waksmanii]|uniref:CAZyme family AA7 n=1 Tax=Penicillium waksmanii TaxID=69791 RepID=UPI0025481DD0|nr:CAZyme family AA7 [Penicillium waksmanii]KAJ5980482.1 CAZyme family AA7 [Penicillium waksmanii]